ncbi:unnamed protein product [Plutella xylostella]|uniref:(diamondback moth) hypothetical protein n=1 Tax=Plutella xylostella TaxID=51655 RepID=A0A8S4G4D2_PLUXY|nr:unnamed protein product [Plutella xylostella]
MKNTTMDCIGKESCNDSDALDNNKIGQEAEEERPNEDEEQNTHFNNNLKMNTSSITNNKPEAAKEEHTLVDSKTVKRFAPIYKQTLAASASILVSFTGRAGSRLLRRAAASAEGPGSLIPGDKDSASWIASMAALPMALGCLISGWMMEKYGRKTSHIIICAPILLGWILIACSKSLTLMLVGRFLTGLCFGLLGPVGPVYIAETTDPKYRGFFLAGVSLAIALAILVAHTIGTFLTWQWTATIFTAFPILSVLLFTLVPESPTWLISKGRTDEGVKSFGWLRGFSDEANKELKGIVEMQKAADSEPKLSFKEKIVSLKCPEFRKPLLIMILFFITNQFAGVNAVAFYSIEIVGKSVGQGLDHYVSMLIIDTVRAVMSVVACVISKRFGRRPLCFISGVWTALSMVGLSMFLYFTEGKSVEHLAFIPLLCLLSYICAVTIGLVPLPWIMCGEVFPTKSRGLGSGISSASAFAAFFVVVKTAPDMMSGLGEVVTFLVYGTVAGVGTIVMYFILPETKGKSLQEIEDKFRGETRYDTKV